MQQPTPSEETQNLLARLSQRPGVQSTLILSRDTGAIVRASGLITPEEIGEDGTTPSNVTYLNGTDGEVKKKGTRKAEEVAQLVYKLVLSAGSMIEELNGESDEAKLLRVRTKKNELVVVPGRRNHTSEAKHTSDLHRLQVSPCCDPRHATSVTRSIWDDAMYQPSIYYSHTLEWNNNIGEHFRCEYSCNLRDDILGLAHRSLGHTRLTNASQRCQRCSRPRRP